jgi:uroporphyrinogen-III decarboxylase
MSDALKKPSIERLLTVMQGGIPDRVPHYEILTESRNVKYFLGRDLGSTMAASRGASEDVFVAPPIDPEDYIELCYKTSQDAMTLEALWTPFKYEDEKGKLHIINDGRINSLKDLEKVIRPSLKLDIEPRREITRNYVRAAKGTGVGVTSIMGAFFQACYYFLCDFNEFLTNIYVDREFIETLMDLCVDYYVKMTEMYVEEGIDFLFVADDIAYRQGSFIEPNLLKELWLPRMNRIIKPAKEAGMPVMFHSCGNLTSIMESIIMELDIDAINPIEPYSMDIYDIKKKYGQEVALCGNIDIAGPLAFGTPEEVRQEVKEHMEGLKEGGRYIMSTCHSIMDDIVPENFQAMIDATIEFGAY